VIHAYLIPPNKYPLIAYYFHLILLKTKIPEPYRPLNMSTEAEESSPHPSAQNAEQNVDQELLELHAPPGILPPPPPQREPQPRRRLRTLSSPVTRQDVRAREIENPSVLVSNVMPEDEARDHFQALSQLNRLIDESRDEQTQRGLTRMPMQPSHHRPSTSLLPITGMVGPGALTNLNLGGGTAIQELMLDRVLGNRECRARLAKVNLEAIRAQSTTRLLGRRSENRWRNLESTFKQFLVWIQENLQGEDYESVNAAWKILWFIEGKIQSRHIQVPSAYKYVKNLAQSLREAGVSVDEEVTDAYKESLKRDGALRAAKQAPPASYKDILATEALLTPNEYLGMRLAWMTASRMGEIQHLRKESFEKKGHLLWSITFPYHKGDPYRLGTNIVVKVSEDLDQMIAHRIEWVPNGQPFSNITTARASAVLAAVREGLTAHSVKRGALTRLLRAGVPLSLIQVIAKHKDLETLMVYLPRAEVSLAMGTHEAVSVLERLV